MLGDARETGTQDSVQEAHEEEKNANRQNIIFALARGCLCRAVSILNRVLGGLAECFIYPMTLIFVARNLCGYPNAMGGSIG